MRGPGTFRGVRQPTWKRLSWRVVSRSGIDPRGSWFHPVYQGGDRRE